MTTKGLLIALALVITGPTLAHAKDCQLSAETATKKYIREYTYGERYNDTGIYYDDDSVYMKKCTQAITGSKKVTCEIAAGRGDDLPEDVYRVILNAHCSKSESVELLTP